MLLFLPLYAHAQALMMSHPVTVSEIRGLPHDSWVTLSGNIINSLPGGRHYTFRDSSGEIIVEIDFRVWRGLYVGVSDRVQISGEVRINRGQISVYVNVLFGNGVANPRPGQALALDHPVTIIEARTLPHDSWVILNGNIINSLPGGRHYTFRDSSGEIIVEIEQRIWRGLILGVDDQVEISGELRVDRGLVTVNAKAIKRV